MRRKILIGVLVLFVLGVIGGGIGFYLWNKQPEGIGNAAADFSGSTEKILQDFKANAANADTQYKDKTLEIEGTVSSIDKEADGTPLLNLEAGGATLQCSFFRDDVAAANAVKVGQLVKVKGRYAGYDDLDGLLIQLRDCAVK